MKKKINLKKIALMGMAGGALMAQSQADAAQQQNNNSYRGNSSYTADGLDTSVQNSSNKALSERDFLSQLNSEGKSTYQSLNKEGKELALKLASQSCKGQNACKGLNSCKTKDNACAGKGGCQGTSKGPFTDKNAAVKVAAKHMAEKRSVINDDD
jgi:hypothetical protein